MSPVDNDEIIDAYIMRLNRSKWSVILRTSKGVQIKKLKKINKLGVWSGLFLLPFWGIGLVIWVLVIIDYWIQKDQIMFISIDQMIKQLEDK